MAFFEGNTESDDKNEYNLFCGKWSTNYCFKVFSFKKSVAVEWKPKKPFKAYFPLYQWFYWGNCFQKQ